MKPVSQRLRNRIVKAGLAFEPPEHVRPKKGPCPYVDTFNPATKTEVDRDFIFEGEYYRITYQAGCFYPFICEHDADEKLSSMGAYSLVKALYKAKEKDRRRQLEALYKKDPHQFLLGNILMLTDNLNKLAARVVELEKHG